MLSLISRIPQNPWVGRFRILVLHAVVWTCASDAGGEWKMYQKSGNQMGTRWHVVLYSEQPDSANAALSSAFSTLAELDQILSDYQADSELNRLCRSAPHPQPVSVSESLWTVLRSAHQLSVRTRGAFDVTVGPLSRRWRRARARKELPTPEVLRRARDHVGFALITYDLAHRRLRLHQPKMRIDLGGIAKGYAVDRLLAVIQDHGIKSALVNGGGDLAVSAPPPGKTSWRVQIAGLGRHASRQQLELRHAAVATSGDAWQFVEVDGKRYSHIIDPRTGVGVTHRVAVSTVATQCLWADAWASALCVLAEAGPPLVAGDVAWRMLRVGEDNIPRITQSADFPSLAPAGEPPAPSAPSTDSTSADGSLSVKRRN